VFVNLPRACVRFSSRLILDYLLLFILSWSHLLAGQQVPVEPFSFETATLSKLSKTQDALSQLDKLEIAVGQVKQGKEPHFATKLGELAESFHDAAEALDKAQVSAGTPRYEHTADGDKKGAVDNLEDYLQQLRGAKAKGIATRSRIDSDISLADRKDRAAAQIASFYRKVVALPLPDYEAQYGPDYLDAYELQREISGYKTSLVRLRNRVDLLITSLQKQINIGSDNLRDPVIRQMISNIKSTDRAREDHLKASTAAVTANRDQRQAVNAGNSANFLRLERIPPSRPGYNPYTTPPRSGPSGPYPGTIQAPASCANSTTNSGSAPAAGVDTKMTTRVCP
jgi:hypothetical protein